MVSNVGGTIAKLRELKIQVNISYLVITSGNAGGVRVGSSLHVSMNAATGSWIGNRTVFYASVREY